ncbi:MAG: tryptophanyl-tRNA synthetase [Hyphomicrobiales bacterium]|jgi:tryptophanyl-tRNA synthetase|nr:tryptophanyl-tRNA synthetase [Hyphomicrobiales bacterium]
MAFKQRVFSGMQASGNPHLGNYLGAIKRWVEMQSQVECIYCVVDLHAITVWQDPAELLRATRDVVAAFMAAGLNPKRSILFNQSQVHQHAELAWVFNCVARIGWLNRMTQFKEKAGKDRENASLGLYAYPSLMAADILLYHATIVPVGEDQKQHVELTRDIAQKFNNDYAESIRKHTGRDVFFPLPEPLIQGEATRVMSLRDGTKKMSKSDASDNSRINLTDDADTIAQKIRRAKTDPEPLPSEVAGLEARPEADNLVGIYAALAGITKAEVLKQFGGGQFSTFKTALSDLAVEKLSPIGAEMKRLTQDPSYIDSVLADGAARAEAIAAETMNAVKDIVGFVRR